MDGLIKGIYGRPRGPVCVSSSRVRSRMNTLPFVVEGLLTLDYEGIYEI